MATDIWLQKLPTGQFVGATEEDAEHLKAFRAGDIIKAKVSKPRNGKHHRLGMLLLHAVYDNQDQYTTFNAFLNEVKILTGHCEMHIGSSGQVYYVTKSISFDRMDEVEFRAWKNDALNAVIRHFIPGMPEADQDRLVNHIFAVA